jgi:hypothetical protein
MSLGKYQFLSWARRGISRHILEKDTLGKSDGAADERARIPVSVELNTGDIETQNFALTGPGDVTGINRRMMIRTEPLEGVADYEPNLLPYIEFYDEDFPFRYTPASPSVSGDHLRPWLALVVLKENEFLETKRREPLTSIQIISESVFPPHDELHLWCHMHSNLPHEESEFEAFLDGLEEDVKTDPDGVYSRLLCPRKLEPKTQYHAFLIPSYETGRRGGLGQPTAGVKAQAPSWPGSDNEYPVYHRWSFRTGKNFDFEYLVKLLRPRIMDKRVGVREMDCSRPAFVRADADAEVRAPKPAVLLLEGAVMAPDATTSNFPPASVAQPFLEDVQKLVNLNRFQQENPDEDPFVSIPYYGMNHAMRRNPGLPGQREIPRFDPASDSWFNELNRDPRTRVPAGFGKRVVQENQEKFVDQAWKQLTAVLEANRQMRLARFAAEVMERVYAKTLNRQLNESYLAFANALGRRVLTGDRTVKAVIDESLVANATLDATFSRMTRNGVSIVRGLNRRTNSAGFSYDTMVRKTNHPQGLSAEVREDFRPITALDGVDQFTAPSSAVNVAAWSRDSNLHEDFAFNQPAFGGGLPAMSFWAQPFNPILFAPLVPVGPVVTPVAPIGPVAPPRDPVTPVSPVGPRLGPAVPVGPVTPVDPRLRPGRPIGPGAALEIPTDSRISGPAAPVRGGPVATGPGTRPPGRLPPGTLDTGPIAPGPTAPGPIAPGAPGQLPLDRVITVIDTAVANNTVPARTHNAQIRVAYAEVSTRWGFTQGRPSAPTLPTRDLRNTLDRAIRPRLSYRHLADRLVRWPAGMFKPPREQFLQAMAYPDIPEPAYEYLLAIDKEFLLPNLHLIENNTLSLLKTNQKFIESYLVGLNHEMGRELLWREYPTDMRGSYFRQFWDVSGFVTPDTTPRDADTLKDIRPIHTWSNRSALGRHNARDAQGDAEQLVFVIRGDLLKKYPNTVIYAQKALKNTEDSGGGPNDTLIRTGEFSDAQYRKEIQFPLYQAEISPDIKLLGFDLTIEQASGHEASPGYPASDKLGWYFVLAEVPGEPHFGMDVSFRPNEAGALTWNDLSWQNLPAGLSFVSGTQAPALAVKSGIPEIWGQSAEHMARILLQRPVMVAIHATEMLDVDIPSDLIFAEALSLNAHIARVRLNRA